nr:hypothetical protein BgiMline_024921 [Biomphalaria glabrata]
MKFTLTPSTKIILGWTVIISVGLYGFTLARDSVVSNRKSLMDIRKRIREQTRTEKEAELESKAAEREKQKIVM